MEVPFQYGRLAEAENFIDRIDDRRELKNFHTNAETFQNVFDELVPSQIALLKAIASGETHFNAKGVVEKYRLGQSQTITRNKKTLVEKDLVEKTRDTLSFVDPLFELWLKREYGIG